MPISTLVQGVYIEALSTLVHRVYIEAHLYFSTRSMY